MRSVSQGFSIEGLYYEAALASNRGGLPREQNRRRVPELAESDLEKLGVWG